MSPKEFALAQIAPYYKDPSSCGYENKIGTCSYFTSDGKMCVAGKNMINPDRYSGDIDEILQENNQFDVFKPESRDILSNHEWRLLQVIHDNIANIHYYPEIPKSDFIIRTKNSFKNSIKLLNLFTFEELKEAAEKL